jgi:hypothetical protein
MLSKPTRMFAIVPVKRAPPLIGTWLPAPARPILLLKNMDTSEPPNELSPTENNPAFSRKNALFSGKNKLNLSKFICCSSASACAKSVL